MLMYLDTNYVLMFIPILFNPPKKRFSQINQHINNIKSHSTYYWYRSKKLILHKIPSLETDRVFPSFLINQNNTNKGIYRKL